MKFAALIVLAVVFLIELAKAQYVIHQGMLRHADGSVTELSDAIGGVVAPSETISQIVDHFSDDNNSTFTQRYFVNETQWNRDDINAPVLLCVGGEGPPLDKTVLSNSVHCNDLVDYSIQKKSLTFALEHRFYGSSMPAEDYSTGNLKAYLSTEQAVQDIGEFILQMKIKYNIPEETPWITFGGSYPGMVAAIARQVLPNQVFAAVSSSAPLLASVAMPGYNEIVGVAYKTKSVGGSEQCFNIIQNGHNTIGEMLKDSSGRRQLERDFNTCGGEGSLEDEMNQAVFANMGVVYFPAQSNDPACTTPLCNIGSVCEYLADDASAGNSAYTSLVHLSSKMSSACKFVSHRAEIAASIPSSSPSRVWLYQTCSEWGYYMTCENSKCPFVQNLPSLQLSLDICKRAFDIDADAVSSNIAKANERYGGNQFPADRVMFINGEVDPWRANSVQESPTGSTSEPVHFTPGSSHHYWTHPDAPTDTEEIIEARQAIFKQLDEWLVRLR